MRRLCISIVALSSLLLPAMPAQAQASVNYQLTARGELAYGYFTTLPSSGPVPGVVYRDTFVLTGSSSTNADGTHSRSEFATVSQSDYTVAQSGEQEQVGYAHGSASAADLVVAITGGLTKASLRAAVPVTRCTVARDGSTTCSDEAAKTLDIDWVGQGEMSHDAFHTSSGAGFLRSIARFDGRHRIASVTAAFGSDRLGAAVAAGMNANKSMSLTICHGC
jgi:hypothetical protein